MPDETTPIRPPLTPLQIGEVPAALRGSVVAIGNFDGVHRGHATLLAAAMQAARRRAAKTVVVTFEPHPRSFFRPQDPVFRLTPLAAKARVLGAMGIDGLVVLPFDETLARTAAADFVDAVLVKGLAASEVVVGYDFHFGRGRAGNAAMLAEAGRAGGFDVTVIPAVLESDGALVSSSVIRDALAAGDVAAANRLLGYRWFISGAVIGGDRRGRDLGFPTANIRLAADCRLRHGIYAVRMTRRAGVFDGVASFGRRPTFDNGAPLLEVFLFDFSGDLYGEEIIVTFHAWGRPEEWFPSVEALVAAMNRDVVAAREALATAGDGTDLDRALRRLA